MNLHLSEEQRLLCEAFRRVFEKESTLARVRAAEPSGIDRELWRQLVDIGAPLLRTPVEMGGAGLGLFEAVLVAEQAGRFLATVPLLEVLVSAGLLGRLGCSVAREWLAQLADGSKILTIALHESTSGTTQLVPGGAVADGVLVLEGDAVVLVELDAAANQLAKGFGPLGATTMEFSLRSGAHRRSVVAAGAASRAMFLSAVEEWKLLVAAVLAALSRQALDEAAAYSRERMAFDRPIGGYQGLAHPLADSVTEVDGARLLVWHAVSRIARQDQQAAYVAMAFWWSARTSATAVVRAMRVFGGYGMAMEYAAQLYFRRSRAWSLLAGDPQSELARVGERLRSVTTEMANPDTGNVSIDFDFGSRAVEFANSARQFFQTHMTEELQRFAFTTQDGHHPEFQRKLAAAGFLYSHWPREHGGADRTPFEAAALREVYAEFGWPKVLPTVTDMVGQIVMRFANKMAQEEILPRLASGAANCALGYSEPSCGSDIFAAKTKAVRDGDEWIIDGQKMWTSQGHLADYVLIIARTDASLPKHAGVTLFMVPIPCAGYAVQEVQTLGNERTNVTYYSGVRVHDRYRIGEINGGAKVLAAALTLEQSGGDFFVGALRTLLKHSMSWARTLRGEAAPIDDPAVRARLAAVAVQVEVADVLDRRCLWASTNHERRKEFGPMAKLFASEALVACSTDLAELAAPWSLHAGMDDTGAIELESRKAVQSTIYGGTSEIQRSIVAESALGMPRTRS